MFTGRNYLRASGRPAGRPPAGRPPAGRPAYTGNRPAYTGNRPEGRGCGGRSPPPIPFKQIFTKI